jgi:hypothetical protein
MKRNYFRVLFTVWYNAYCKEQETCVAVCSDRQDAYRTCERMRTEFKACDMGVYGVDVTVVCPTGVPV